MNEKKTLEIGRHRIELIVPDSSRDLKFSYENNINAYDENGKLLWNISELIRAYSENKGLKYFSDMYFDIRLLDEERIFCIGFTNHCEIDLKSGCLTRLVNNR